MRYSAILLSLLPKSNDPIGCPIHGVDIQCDIDTADQKKKRNSGALWG